MKSLRVRVIEAILGKLRTSFIEDTSTGERAVKLKDPKSGFMALIRLPISWGGSRE